MGLRWRLQLSQRSGAVLVDASFDPPVVTIGGGEDDTLRVPNFPVGFATLSTQGETSWVHFQSEKDPHLVDSVTVFDLGEWQLTVTPTFATDSATDTCPRCSSPLDDALVRAGYRSVATRQQDCRQCGGSLLDLEAVGELIGGFTDASSFEWVNVTSRDACPRCRMAMARAPFKTAHGEAQVEQCAPCRVVFLDAEDLLALG